MITSILFIFLMSLGSIHADDTNSTDETLNPQTPPIIDPPSGEITPEGKTFTNLENEIENAPDNSVLVISGKYTYDSATDESLKKGVVISKNLEIIGTNDCVIDGNKKARCLKIESGCSVTLKGITFTNGYSKSSGGAIYLCSYSKLHVYDCFFKNNVASKSNGGAIATGYETELDIHGTKFHSNKATGSNSKNGMGGAIKVNLGSKLTLDKCEFKKNKAHLSIILVVSHNKKMGTKTSKAYVRDCLFEKNTADINGVFYLDEYGRGTFINCIFKNNVAKKEGILILDASKYALVKDCKFIKNTAIYGAAVKLVKHGSSISHVTITGCTFTKNHAKKAGGAILSYSGDLKIKNCKFTQNRATVSGGAVEARGGKVKMTKLTFKKNRATYGGAILIKDRKSVYLCKAKFIKNKAKQGKNVLAIYHHTLSKLKNRYNNKLLINITVTKKNETKLKYAKSIK
jgi:predicted outer membrane repeat protein